MPLKKYLNDLLAFVSDDEDPDEPVYDPRHVAALIVIVLFSMNVLFWLLWALLVFGGGIQAKLLPFLQLLFSAKTAADFGYAGYPYEMGVFEGWVTNVVALVFLLALISSIWYIFNAKIKGGKREPL
jgi:hypothetical protein